MVGLLCVDSLLVTFEITSMGETLLTFLALVGPLTSVDSLVLYQITNFRETLLALRTLFNCSLFNGNGTC